MAGVHGRHETDPNPQIPSHRPTSEVWAARDCTAARTRIAVTIAVRVGGMGTGRLAIRKAGLRRWSGCQESVNRESDRNDSNHSKNHPSVPPGHICPKPLEGCRKIGLHRLHTLLEPGHACVQFTNRVPMAALCLPCPLFRTQSVSLSNVREDNSRRVSTPPRSPAGSRQ